MFYFYLPLIYGEGDRAFIRLRETTVQDNDDPSLFAWTSTNPDSVITLRDLYPQPARIQELQQA